MSTDQTTDDLDGGLAADALTDKEKRRRSLGLLGALIKPYRVQVSWVAVLTLVVQVCTVVGPALIAFGIDSALPALGEGNASLAIGVGVTYIVIAIVRALSTYWYLRVSTWAGQRILYNLRRRMFRHTQRLSLGFHERYTSGRVISRQTNDTESLRELLEFGVETIVGAPMLMLLTVVTIVWMDWLTGALMLLLLVPGLFMSRWFQRASSRTYRQQRTHSARLTVEFVETMGGMRAVQAFRREEANDRRYGEVANDYRAASLKAVRIWGIYQPSLRLLGNLIVVAVLVVGGLRVISGNLEVGVLLALVLYSRRFFQPIDMIANFYNVLQSAVSALEKISALLAEDPDIPEPEHPKQLTASGGGEVRFEGASFRYSDDGPQVLHPLDLEIPAGQTVALVGQTGAGKSTVAKLISRFYDVTEGRVTLDGIDLRDLRDEDLRQAMVMVTQESYLFGGSIADNIAVGKPGATREEIEAAAAAIGAHEFITRMPDGYDTDVHTRGGRLSAGQRQLVSFARAFLADPRVLILDEATSSLDIPSERAVQNGLEQLLGDRTSIMIAHRLATVMIADRVLVVHDGRIVEDGSPRDLIEAGGRFAELYRAWQESL
ncbi:ABC transporter ATP-binding protein [Gulosibacter faecalis]|uniref:ABC transporter ATP-binding protein n=1 Tax=Gulosibacter faecalis TaxID=272240 RepID=A0ABW5UV03_9MICO|nr:ABC transporter ATP-binding protein [Gulosibacter faecalis]